MSSEHRLKRLGLDKVPKEQLQEQLRKMQQEAGQRIAQAKQSKPVAK